MMIGYARTSTTEQRAGLDAQVRDLLANGVAERDIHSEQVSSVAQRDKLDMLLGHILREGDTLVVTRLDRLARSTADLLRIVEHLNGMGVKLRVLDPDIRTDGPIGQLIVTILGAVAQFERQIMLSRQREGIDAAKRAGKYRGRAPTVRRQRATILAMKGEGLTNAEIARRLGCHKANVGRVLRAA
jgi:DNA invertase Pin-like site-specific DNA recombinase